MIDTIAFSCWCQKNIYLFQLSHSTFIAPFSFDHCYKYLSWHFTLTPRKVIDWKSTETVAMVLKTFYLVFLTNFISRTATSKFHISFTCLCLPNVSKRSHWTSSSNFLLRSPLKASSAWINAFWAKIANLEETTGRNLSCNNLHSDVKLRNNY